MTLDLSKRGRTTQDKILQSIVDRLIAEIDELTSDSCWLSDQAIPISMPAGRFAVTVSPGAGNFPQEFFSGGGAQTLTEECQVVITPLVVSPSDRPRRKWRKITGGETGNEFPSLLYFKHAILKAVLADPEWEPRDGDIPLLRDMLSPVSCSDARDVSVGETLASAMQIRFATVFDWDLTNG